MRKYIGYILAAVIVTAMAAVISVWFVNSKAAYIKEYTQVERAPKIKPDYSDIVIPFNIAAMNFVIKEEGEAFFVKIYSEKGEAIEIFSRKPKIRIPDKTWGNLLKDNKGSKLCYDIFVRTKDKGWKKFLTINNKISNEPIDDFIVYRNIQPVHGQWSKMAICQRNLCSYKICEILNNDYLRKSCLNCHCFNNNRTDKMMLAVRSSMYGSKTIMIEEGMPSKLDAKFTYPCWHPSGKLVVYSVADIKQFFHSAANEVRDVIDVDSLLAYYMVDSRVIKTSPKIAQKEWLETYPTWAADGKYLYFCSAAKLWEGAQEIPYTQCEKIKYDLVRISYDLANDKWGEIETVLSAKDTGLSILEPRISPDGRWLLVVMCNYGCFPVYQQSSDLYLIDLKKAEETGRYEYKRLEINSDQSESWHSWSSNGRWIAFSSKRDSQPFTRIYFSYIDEAGKVYKPFVMPQQDGEFYDSCLFTFSVPEFITEPVKVRAGSLAGVIRGEDKIHLEMPMTMATPKAISSPESSKVWQERE